MKASRLFRVWLGGSAVTPGLGLDPRPPSGQYVNVIAEGTMPRPSPASSTETKIGVHLDAEHTAISPLMFIPPERRHVIHHFQARAKPLSSRWKKALRPDIYDELLKLPLRYRLHSFETLHAHLFPPVPLEEAVRDAHSAEAGDRAPPPPLPPGIFKVSRQGDAPTSPEAAEANESTFDYYAVSGKMSSAVGYAPPLGPADLLDTIPFFVHRSSNGRLPGKIYSMNPRNLMPAFYLRIQGVDGDVFRFEEELMKIFPTKKIFVRSHSVYVYNVGMDGREILHHWLLGLGF